jgi:TRAP-type C4-dicarboxylate transport system permease small subunit
VFDFLYSLLLTYSQVVLVVIVVVVSAQVISRKFLGTSIRWSEEVALFFMIWMAFISMAVGVQKHLHIAVGFFFNLLPPTAAKVVDKLVTLIIMSFGAFHGLRWFQTCEFNDVFYTARYPVAGRYGISDDSRGRHLYRLFYLLVFVRAGKIPAY